MVEFDEIAGAFGGYHRYDFTDHAYLYNLYFPGPQILDHLRGHLPQLLMHYPMGQDRMANLLSAWTGHAAQNLVAANGAAEIIKIICGVTAKKIIIPVPSFNEYINAALKGNVIRFALHPPDFKLDTSALGRTAVRAGVDAVVVVNPNNPTSIGNDAAELFELFKGLKKNAIRLIVDESFVDFTDDPDTVSLESQVASEPGICIIKSMSKAFGICGLRLGYMACSDKDWLGEVKNGLPIWNINGPAEEFLRILPEFREQFHESCEKVKQDRDDFYKKLKAISGLQAFKPWANFVFVKLPENTVSAKKITRMMFDRYKILVKNCGEKIKNEKDSYLRIACRTKPENQRLVDCLAALLAENR